MHTLFNPENKFWNFMGKITDVSCMSLLWLLTSLPVFTIGASTAAFYSFTLDAVGDNEGRVIGSYFSAFKANFKKATLLWLLQLTLGALLAVNLYAAWNFYLTKGIIALGFLSLSGCAALVAICCSVYIYPILAAYDFPVKKILMDSFIMATGNLHVTISVVVLFLLAAVGIYYFGGLFFFWIGLAIFFSSYFIWGLFLKYAGVKIEKKKKKKNPPMDPYLNCHEYRFPHPLLVRRRV